MKVLKHGDLVRLETWRGSLAKVGSVEGFARQYGNDPDAALKREQERGFSIAWINALPTTISAAAHFHQRAKVEHASAIVLTADEFVSIEGRTYRTRVRTGNINGARDQDALQLVPA